MAYIFLLLLAVAWTCSNVTCTGRSRLAIKEHKKDVDVECAKRFEKKFPRFKQHFKLEFLIHRCKNHRIWHDKATKGSFKPRHQLTSKHLDFLRSLSCHNRQCQPSDQAAPKDEPSVAPRVAVNLAAPLLKPEPILAPLLAPVIDLLGLLTRPQPSTTKATTPKATVTTTKVPVTTQIPVTTTKPTTSTAPVTTTKPTTSTSKATVTTTKVTTPAPPPKAFRKDIRAMTDNERIRMFSALQTLKTQMIDGVSKYDIFVSYHSYDQSPLAHHDAAFLPFHREYLNNLEIALRQIDPTVSLPYWDSILDSELPTPSDSILWTDAFLGNNQGEVVSGPLANWTTVQYEDESENLSPTYKIMRAVGKETWGSPIRLEDLQEILALPDYQSLVSCGSGVFFESVHDMVHVFVGGHMMYVPIAPNDFIFWMHHAFIDGIWEMWRESKQTYAQRPVDYYVPPRNNECEESVARSYDLMKPFEPKKIIDGLSNIYTDKYFTYQFRANCTNSCHGSPYLFCHQVKNRCMSKVRPNGDCTGFGGLDICYKGVCTGGRCVPNTNK